MGITLVDVDTGDVAAVERELSEAVKQTKVANTATKTVEKPQQPVTRDVVPDDAEIPEKLRGKSLAEVVSIYRNLESRYGTMANDLGVQRKLTDRLLDLKRDDDLSRNSPRTEPVQIKSNELLDNPTEALDRFVSDRTAPLASETKARLDQIEHSLARTAFVQKHPDFQDIANDQGFVDWVVKSPYRAKAAQAAYGGDWAAADELLSEYKQVRTPVNTTQDDPTPDNGNGNDGVARAKRVALESGTSADNTADTTTSGRVYRRADLIRLKLEQPEKYYDPDFQHEITLAYAQKRVK